MSRAHELAQLSRLDLVTLWLRAYPTISGPIATAAVASATNEQLVAAIVAREEHDQ